MAGSQDVDMFKSFESKFDGILNAVNVLSTRLTEVEGVAYNNSSSTITSSGVY